MALVGAVAVGEAVVGEDVEEVAVVGAVAEAKKLYHPPDWIKRLPVLGVGIGFRKSLKKSIFSHHKAIDFLEIITDQYIKPSLFQRIELSQLKQLFPLVPHSLNLSLASADGLDSDYLKEVASVVRAVRPPWWSDHISMTRGGPLDIGHLAPVPFTHEFIQLIQNNIREVKKAIHTPFVLENISYTHKFYNEISESRFLTEIVEGSDSGMLLDLMNLYANSRNHGYDPYQFLEEIPLERVVQVHVIGGHLERGLIVDSHSSATPSEVWDLLRYVAKRVQIKALLLEWDDRFPNFEIILNELAIAKEILNGCHTFTNS